jgi:hypothetical protein
MRGKSGVGPRGYLVKGFSKGYLYSRSITLPAMEIKREAGGRSCEEGS